MGGVLLRPRSEYSQLLESLRHGWAEHGGPFSPPLDLAKFLRVSRPFEDPGRFDNLKSVCWWEDNFLLQLTLISSLQAFISLETVSSEVDADDNLFAFDSFSSSSRMIILPRIRFSSKEL